MEGMNTPYQDGNIIDNDPRFKFSSPNIRSNFIKKVYSILCVQLTFTSICVTFTASNPNSVKFFKDNPWLMLLSSIVLIVTMYSLFCYRSLSRQIPLNYILLTLFTWAMSFSACASVSTFEPQIVIIAAVLTALVVVALTLYACTTKSDFTYCGGLLFICSLLLIGSIILSIIFQSHFLQIIISVFICLLYGVYLIYDTQLVVGGKNYQLEVDDYIIGALALYIDIVYLFLEILRLLGNNRN